MYVGTNIHARHGALRLAASTDGHAGAPLIIEARDNQAVVCTRFYLDDAALIAVLVEAINNAVAPPPEATGGASK